MGAPLPLSVLRQQPQQGAPLDRSNRFAAGALAVLTPTVDINWATGKQLTRAGSGYALSALGGFQTLVHRKNNYVETELLPAIGTQSYVAFWLGYPVAAGTSGNSSEPSFVLGSSNNTVGICTTTGSTRTVSIGTGGTSNSSYWGGCNSIWPIIYGSSDGIPSIGATSGRPVMLMMVRNQNSLDFWRDGVMVRSLPVTLTSIAAFKLISGAFVEGTSWYASANMALCGLSVFSSDPTYAELAVFSANPWALWKAPTSLPYLTALAALTGSGSTSSNIAAGTATVSVAGLAASVSAPTIIAAAVASVVSAGLPASIVTPTSISCGVAAVSVQGQAAQIVAPTVIPCATAAVAVTGLSATVSSDNGVSCSTAAVSVQGLPASITTGTAINCATAVVTVSGDAAQVVTPTVISCATAVVAAVGMPATIVIPTEISSRAGAVAVVGQAAEVVTADAIVCGTACVSVQGQPAAIASLAPPLMPNPKRTYLARPRVREYIAQRRVREL